MSASNPLGTSVGASIASAGITGGLNLASNVWTNFMNSRENAKQREFQREMMEKQMEYNSPVNQRKMLEQAGYSPAAYLDGAKAQGVGGSTPNVIPMQSFQASDSLNAGLNALFQRLKAKADIDNVNADTARKEFDLGVEQDSVVDTLNKRYAESREATANATIAAEQARLLELYGDKRTQAQINELSERAKNLASQSLTQDNIRKFYDAYSDLMRGRNRREQQKLKGELSVLFATADELTKRANLEEEKSEYQEMYNRNYSHFGYSLMESAMKQGFAVEEQIRNLADKLKQDSRVSQKNADWYDANMLSGMAARLTGVARDIQQIQSSSLTDDLKREAMDLQWQKFEESLTPDESNVLEEYYDANGALRGTRMRTQRTGKVGKVP